MKNIFWLFLLPLILYSCMPSGKSPAHNTAQADAEAYLDSVSRVFIPDSRDDIRMLHIAIRNDSAILKGMTNRRDLHRALATHFKENYTFVDSSLLLPDVALGADTFAIVKTSVANLRDAPRHSAQLVTQSLMGMPLKVYYEKEGWFLIRTVENYIAWVDDGGLMPIDKAAFDRWQQSDRLIFLPISGEAYEGPAMKETATNLVLGNVVQIVQAGHPVKIRLPNGRLAYANASSFKRLDKWSHQVHPTADQTIHLARELLGRPYLWGGTSVYGMDCSGFTKTIFLRQGVVIPRDASQQVKAGKKVPLDDSLSQLKKGDLIFFGTKREDGSNRITHVAIYMGDGRIIHATGRVKIESLNPDDPLFNKHRYETMLEARRYIGYVDSLGLMPVYETMYYE